MRRADCTVVIPVKGTWHAKSRLERNDGGELALAMALDTAEAALAAPGVAAVIVVTAAEVAARFDELGATIVADPGGGLFSAIEAGLAQVSPAHSSAVLLGDLPAMRSSELESALAAAGEFERSMVADADGTGTALVTAASGLAHFLAFGPGSRAAHAAAGYRELHGDWPGLRRDIDLIEHLGQLELVVGSRTTLLLRSSIDRRKPGAES